MSDLEKPLLPVELILRILESLAPTKDIALPPHHPTARGIRSFLTVCRTTYPTALRLLYTHCLYIDESTRLQHLLLGLDRIAKDEASSQPIHDYDTHEIHTPSTPTPRTLPDVDIRPCIQNLYLAPFKTHSIDDLPTAVWIHELFSVARYTLRRLVLNIPFDTLSVYRDHLNVHKWLELGLQELTAIEEFICPNQGLAQRSPAPPVWQTWTKLRKLAVYINDDDEHNTWTYNLGCSPCLQQVVIFPEVPRPKPHLSSDVRNIMSERDNDVDITCINAWPPQNFGDDDEAGVRYSLAWRIIDGIKLDRVWNTDYRQNSAMVKLRVVVLDMAGLGAGCADFHTMNAYWPLQAWVRDEAVKGCLWDMHVGERFKQSELRRDVWVNDAFDDTRWPFWVRG